MPPSVCRICLATGVRMITIGGALQPVYEKISGIALHIYQRPIVACYICHALLTKAQSLMLRAITAEKALQALLIVCPVITETSVSAVDRSAAGLCLSLSVSKLEYLDNIHLASGAEVKTEDCNNQVNGVSENDLEEESISPLDSCTTGAVTSEAVAPNLDTEQPLNSHANRELVDSEGSDHNGSVSAAAASDVKSESDGEAADCSINPRAEVEGSVSAAAASDVKSESDDEAADCSVNPRAEVEGSVSPAAASDVESESDEEAAGSSNNPRAKMEGSVSAAAASDVESESDEEAAGSSNSRAEVEGSVSPAAATDVESESDGEAAGSSNNPRAEVGGSVSPAAASDVESDSDGEAADSSLNPQAEVEGSVSAAAASDVDSERDDEAAGSSYNPLEEEEDMDAQGFEDTEALNQCEICARGFARACTLRRHVNAHAARSLRCQCRRQFKYRIQLQKHLSLCKRTQQVKCGVCQRLFPNKFLLDQHKCIQWCETKEQLQKPVQTHKKYYCDLCQGQFHDKNNLNRHIREKHTSDPFRCNICQYQCHNRRGFERHLKTHVDLCKCNICQREFSSHKILERHMSKHAINKRTILKTESYKCQVCSREFLLKCTLSRHLAMHKAESAPTHEPDAEKTEPLKLAILKQNFGSKSVKKSNYQCHICPYRSNVSSSLRRHLKTHVIQKFACTVCKLHVSSKLALYYHMKWHKDLERHKAEPVSNKVNERNYQCHICPYRSDLASNVKIHLKTHIIQKVVCTVCKLRVSSKLALRHHMKLHKDLEMHKAEPVSNKVKERNYQCHICPYRSDQVSSVKMHLKTHIIQKVVCTVCKLRVSSKLALRHHMKLHKDLEMHKAEPDLNRVKKRKYQCHTCPYRSAYLRNVNAHLKTHLSQKVACKVCKMRVSSKAALVHHMKLHKDLEMHKAEPDLNRVKKRKYQCHTCPYRSAYLRNVNAHLKTHLSQKVACKVCKMRVSSKAALRHHMKLHKDLEMHKAEPDSNQVKERNHQCHICPYGSDASTSLKRHLKTHVIQKFACTVCKLHVSSNLALRYHMKLHKDLEMHKAEPDLNRVKKRKYQCHKCPYRSAYLRNVNAHLKTHLSQKVACKVCKIRVSSKAALVHHMKLHKDIFNCTACQRCFATADALKAHMAAHEPDEEETEEQMAVTSGDKLQCSLCPMQFNLKIAFRRHIISEHL